MPRKAPPPIATVPLTSLSLYAPPPPSPVVQRLRQDARWAAISQFCWMFSDAFGLLDWDIENLEADFDGDETQLIPTLLVKLLFALTYNRQINRENVMEHIRKQYTKRSLACPLGTAEEPVEWGTLGLGSKVQILYELCELQMEEPARFRALLKSEEEAVSWRIDPVGWDKAGNTYFLFDDNRLWVQRLPPAPPAPPRPPEKSSLKAKRALKRQRHAAPDDTETGTDEKVQASSSKTRSKASSSQRKKVVAKAEDDDDYGGGRRDDDNDDDDDDLTPPPPPATPLFDQTLPLLSGSRRRTQVAFYGNVMSTVDALKRGGPSTSSASPRMGRDSLGAAGGDASSSRSRPTRSSGIMVIDPGVDMDAVETPSKRARTSRSSLAHTKGVEAPGSGVLAGTPSSIKKGKGRAVIETNTESPMASSRNARTTRRSRGAVGAGEEEWEQIPEEWLKPVSASDSAALDGDSSGNDKAKVNARGGRSTRASRMGDVNGHSKGKEQSNGSKARAVAVGGSRSTRRSVVDPGAGDDEDAAESGDESELSDLTDEEEHQLKVSKAGVGNGESSSKLLSEDDDGDVKMDENEPDPPSVEQASSLKTGPELVIPAPGATGDREDSPELTPAPEETAVEVGPLESDAMDVDGVEIDGVDVAPQGSRRQDDPEEKGATALPTAAKEVDVEAATAETATAAVAEPGSNVEISPVSEDAVMSDPHPSSTGKPHEDGEKAEIDHAKKSPSSNGETLALPAASEKSKEATPPTTSIVNTADQEAVLGVGSGQNGVVNNGIAAGEEPGIDVKIQSETKPEDAAMTESKVGDNVVPQKQEEVDQPEEDDEDETDEVKLAVREAKNLPEGFVEWEAVCVTLYDWRTWPEQFSKSRDPDEKSLYAVLEAAAPTVIEALIIKEQERLKQIAVLNRKRSSRIATRELEKEEQLRQEQAQKEMEERMEKSRAEEARKTREEAELIARDKAREERLREREERVVARGEAEKEVKEREGKLRESRYRNRGMVGTNGGAGVGNGNGTGTGAEAAWELACEVCKKTGWNLDDEEDIVACEDCGRWQHMECHDRQDVREGRAKRNWDKVEFRCKECRRKRHERKQQHQIHAEAMANQAHPSHQPNQLHYQHQPNHPHQNGYSHIPLPTHFSDHRQPTSSQYAAPRPHPVQAHPSYHVPHPASLGSSHHSNPSRSHPYPPPGPYVQSPGLSPQRHNEAGALGMPIPSSGRSIRLSSVAPTTIPTGERRSSGPYAAAPHNTQGFSAASPGNATSSYRGSESHAQSSASAPYPGQIHGRGQHAPPHPHSDAAVNGHGNHQHRSAYPPPHQQEASQRGPAPFPPPPHQQPYQPRPSQQQPQPQPPHRGSFDRSDRQLPSIHPSHQHQHQHQHPPPDPHPHPHSQQAHAPPYSITQGTYGHQGPSSTAYSPSRAGPDGYAGVASSPIHAEYNRRSSAEYQYQQQQQRPAPPHHPEPTRRISGPPQLPPMYSHSQPSLPPHPQQQQQYLPQHQHQQSHQHRPQAYAPPQGHYPPPQPGVQPPLPAPTQTQGQGRGGYPAHPHPSPDARIHPQPQQEQQ